MKSGTIFWLEKNAREAQEFYLKAIPGSKAGKDLVYTAASAKLHSVEPGTLMQCEVILPDESTLFLVNGGMVLKPSQATSVLLMVDSQEELDAVWNGLIADGGEEVICGFCKDKYGFAWQVCPTKMDEWQRGPGAAAVMQAMMTMKKLDYAKLEAAANTVDDIDAITPFPVGEWSAPEAQENAKKKEAESESTEAPDAKKQKTSE